MMSRRASHCDSLGVVRLERVIIPARFICAGYKSIKCDEVARPRQSVLVRSPADYVRLGPDDGYPGGRGGTLQWQ